MKGLNIEQIYLIQLCTEYISTMASTELAMKPSAAAAAADLSDVSPTLASSLSQPDSFIDRFGPMLKAPQFYVTLTVFVIAEIVVSTTDCNVLYHFLSLYFFFLTASAPIATTGFTFFKGEIEQDSKTNQSFLVLAASTMISWIFAKVRLTEEV